MGRPKKEVEEIGPQPDYIKDILTRQEGKIIEMEERILRVERQVYKRRFGNNNL